MNYAITHIHPPFDPNCKVCVVRDRPGLAEAIVAAGPPPDALMDGTEAGQNLRSWWLDKYAPVLRAAREAAARSSGETFLPGGGESADYWRGYHAALAANPAPAGLRTVIRGAHPGCFLCADCVAVIDAARPSGEVDALRIRTAIVAIYDTNDGESWRLVPMESDGGVMASGIPDGLLDAIVSAALDGRREEG